MSLSLQASSIDEAKVKIKTIADGYTLKAYGDMAGSLFIRGTIIPKNEILENPSRFSYCPKALSKKNNRANRAGETLFYCSTNLRTVFNELSPQAGDLLYISYWLTSHHMFVIPVGYTQEVLNKLNSKAELAVKIEDPDFHNKIATDYRTKLFFDAFTKTNINDPNLDYIESIAIAEHYFTPAILDGHDWQRRGFANVYQDDQGRTSKIQDALMYPSIKDPDGTNFAIRPEFVDHHMSVMRVDCFEIQEDGSPEFIRYAPKPIDQSMAWNQAENYERWSFDTPEGPIMVFWFEGRISLYLQSPELPFDKTKLRYI